MASRRRLTSCSPIRLKRVYEPPEPADGCRVLVERLRPRGLIKEKACVDVWLKEIAPSTELRKCFAHDPAEWAEFQRRYRSELSRKSEAVSQLLDLVCKGPVTLVYAAADPQHNSAVVLKRYVENRSKSAGGQSTR